MSPHPLGRPNGEETSDVHAGQVAALQHQLDAVLAECRRLRAENEELRARLRPPEQSPPHEIPPPAPSQPLLITPDPLPTVNERSPQEEKLGLFRVLFRGREDVYAVLWENTRTGRRGYAPAVKGDWRDRKPGAKLSAENYLPLSDDVIHQHLDGRHTIGVYPLLPDDTCWFLVCDFDGKGAIRETAVPRSATSPPPVWGLDASAFVATCEQYGIPAYLERSRSGTGGHVWIFFEAPVPAVSARRLGFSLLRETMDLRATLDLATYDRLFPSQDVLPKGGFGSLIALPLQGHARTSGNTVFLDRDLRPLADQWAFLSGVRRLTPDQLQQILVGLSPPMIGPETRRVNRAAQRKDQPAPPRIHCIVETGLSLEKAGWPSWLVAECKHLASLHNPVFYERQKLRLSTYRTPRFIRCYEEDLTHLHLPRGLLEELQQTMRSAGSELVVMDQRPTPPHRSFRFTGRLTSIQKEAVQELLKHEQGVLVAPPGLGKTVMACAVIAQRNVPTLVLTHRQPLLDQWQDTLREWLGLAPSEVGELRGGTYRASQFVDVAMIQSLQRRQDLPSFFGQYSLLVVDECHHVPAFSFEACLKQAPVRYVLGLTATPYRRDGLQELITMQCGPIRYTVSSRERSSGREPVRELIVRETLFEMPRIAEASIQEVFSALSADTERTTLIVADVVAAVREGRRCLLLSERRAHCEMLATQLIGMGLQPFVLTGGVTVKARATKMEAIHAAPSDQPFLLIATGQYLGEGFDCPQIDTLFLSFPISFTGKVVQYIGRLLRPHRGKTVIRLYEYADTQVPVLTHMHRKRMKTYSRLGFESSPTCSGGLLD